MKKRTDGRYAKKITINGKQVFFYSSEPTERKAELDIMRQMVAYTEKEEKGKTFAEVANEWERIKREQVSEVTWLRCYRSHYNALVNTFDDTEIKDITPKDIDRYIKKLCQPDATGKLPAQKTITERKNVLNMIFSHAFVTGDIESNFISAVKINANLPKKARKMPTDSEIEVIKNHYKGFDFLPFFLLYTGLRISEALALTSEDFDFDNRIINVNKKISWITNKPTVVYKTKTTAGTRKVPIIDKLYDKMQKDFNGYLFCDDEGLPFTRIQLQRRWEKWKKKYNVSITAHQLRHGFCTLAFEAGLEAKEMQEIIGHANISTTMDIYTELRQKKNDEILKKLNSYDF